MLLNADGWRVVGWWWLVAGHGHCEAAGRVATVLGKDFKPYMCLVVVWICPKTVYNYV